MRYAILSDIHGNFEALEAVLGSLQNEVIDCYVCLGDIVGYGPEPARCLREIRKYADLIIAGNHDYAVADKISKGEMDVTIDVKSKDEIGDLAKSFERMVAAVRFLSQDQEKGGK